MNSFSLRAFVWNAEFLEGIVIRLVQSKNFVTVKHSVNYSRVQTKCGFAKTLNLTILIMAY